ncbi:MAG: hypothetical protein QGH53_02840, partial [Prochlorococcaceae cyanobacterium ETNP18_MAG_1]|nr:hypothetical protein [Prochlorococcaceae cyanobacterium ETNP18_MAG_1]
NQARKISPRLSKQAIQGKHSRSSKSEDDPAKNHYNTFLQRVINPCLALKETNQQISEPISTAKLAGFILAID